MTTYPLGGQLTDWKVTISQRLTHGSEGSEPHIRFPCLRIWHWEEEPLEHLALMASGACVQDLHGTGGIGDSTFERWTQVFMCTGSEAKQKLYKDLGQTCLWFLEDLLGKQGMTTVHCEGRTLEAKVLKKISMNPFRGGHFGKIWPHPSALRILSPKEKPGKAGGNTDSPNSKQAAKDPPPTPGTQPPLITPRDKAPPIREIRVSSTYQWVGTSPSHQEACSKPLYQL